MNDNRKYVFVLIILLTGIIFLVKLFTIQVTDETYAKAATDNIVERVVNYPFRGLVYDRNGRLMVFNNPQYDINVIPQQAVIPDTALLCNLLNLTREELEVRIEAAKNYSRVKPSPIFKMVSNHEFASIQNHLVDYPGIEIQARTTRAYTYPVLSNTLGFVAEISKDELENDPERYYRQGDYIGKSGIEAFYEEQLRGKRGVQYKLKNVQGVDKGSFENGKYDTLPVPGSNLISSIDLDLQLYAEKLLKGKVGSIVAIEPETGEILTMVSGPSYDPGLLTGRMFSENFLEISKDTLDPLFNRPIMAMYPPGSIFKIIQALIGLQEGVLKTDQKIYLDGSYIGDHAPPGYYDLHKAIMKSSNNYFHLAFRRIINQNKDPNTYIDSRLGLDNWKSHISKFGLGATLGVDLPNEKGGHIPGSDYYDNLYGRNRWKFSTIASLSIGQGEMLLSPIQMANLAVIIANRGFYYAPHIIKTVGATNKPLEQYLVRNESGIDTAHFEFVINAMRDALYGTAPRAIIRDIEVCGKTGTAENPHGADHSVFMAFAPKDDPKIAVSVYVENAGWGGRAAASTASLVIERYLRGHITKKWLENYVLAGKFLDEEN